MSRAARYDETAHEFVFGFYLRGWDRDKAIPEIRKVYPGFAPKTWDAWRAKFDWAQRRALADAKARDFDRYAGEAWRELLFDLREVHQKLMADFRKSEAADPQIAYAINSTAKQIGDIISRHGKAQDPQRVAMEILQLAMESLLTDMRMVKGLGAGLKRNAEEIGGLVQKIAEKFGRTG